MKELKTSEAQRRATRKWEQNNPDAKRYSRNKGNARTFARKYAKTLEEVEELVDIFKKENPNYKKWLCNYTPSVTRLNLVKNLQKYIIFFDIIWIFLFY